MDITKTDITILMVSTVLVILMALTFPALGLVEDTDINNSQELYDRFPELDVSVDRFDLVGEFPSPFVDENTANTDNSIIAPEHGPYTSVFDSDDDSNLVWIFDNELYFYYQAYNQSTDLGGLFSPKEYDEGIAFYFQHSPEIDNAFQIGAQSAFTQFHIPASEGALSSGTMETNADDLSGNFTLQISIENVEFDGNKNISTFEFSLENTPDKNTEDPGLLTRALGNMVGWVPVLGPVLKAGVYGIGATASAANFSIIGGIIHVATWFFDVIVWFPLTIFEFLLNIVGGLYDSTAYLFGFIAVLVAVLIGVISTLPAPVALFYILPVFGLFTVSAKFLIIGVRTLPFT